MSIVKSYGCDICGRIIEAANVVGVSLQADLYETSASFKTDVAHPERCQVHYCLDCYRTDVLVPAENENPRRVNEEKHQTTYKEFSYMLRRRAVGNWRVSKYFKK